MPMPGYAVGMILPTRLCRAQGWRVTSRPSPAPTTLPRLPAPRTACWIRAKSAAPLGCLSLTGARAWRKFYRRPEVRISVCIATYNGAAYLPAQLQSIQTQLTAEDEIIIADDASSDNTCALIEALQDSRIRLLAGRERCGHVARFAEALQAAEGDILMLADQDDIWLPGRVEAIRKALSQPGVLLVAGQFEQMNAAGEPLPPPERSEERRVGK